MLTFVKLKRPRQLMPDFVRRGLVSGKVMDRYLERPAYQQNDYLGWIARAVREETKQKRLDQMIAELKRGNVYMKMKWNPR